MTRGVVLAGLREGGDDLAVALWRHAVGTGGVNEAVLAAALGRPELADELASVVGSLGWELELQLAKGRHLGDATLEALSRSKRKRTLEALAARRDLPEVVARRFLRRSNDTLRRGALAQPSLGTSERLAVLHDEGPRDPSELRGWCVHDDEFAEWYLSGVLLVAAVSGAARSRAWSRAWSLAGGGWSAAPHEVVLAHLPRSTGNASLCALGGAAVSACSPGELRRWVRQGRLSGELLAAVLDRLEEDGFDGGDVAAALAGVCSRPVPSWDGRDTRRCWDDAPTLERAAASRYAALRNAALRNPLVSRRALEAAIAEGRAGCSEKLLAAVAENTALDDALCHDLLDALVEVGGALGRSGPAVVLVAHAGGREWLRAQLVATTADQVMEQLAHWAERRWRSGATPAWFAEWFREDVVVELISARSGDADAWGFCSFATAVVQSWPEQVTTVVSALRGEDRLSDPLASALVRGLSDRLGECGAAEVFVSLLGGWEGAVDELVECATSVAAAT